MNDDIPDYTRSGSSESLIPVPARLPEEIVEDLDERIENGEFDSRSEAVRELIEERIRSY